tara:strand:- start:3463 stop:4239 length:777 start_codon:yes stop_codon:yes gene_type:complete
MQVKEENEILSQLDEHIKELSVNEKQKLQTEDLGIIFEMAICIKKNIPFKGAFKYSLEKAEEISKKLEKWNYPYELVHTAECKGQYDFTGSEDKLIKLSAKTNKKGGKISPQILGQPTKNTFCKHFELSQKMTQSEIKEYILKNVNKMLSKYYEFTFDADILYYSEEKDEILFIKMIKEIPWQDYEIIFTRNSLDSESKKFWNESSSISVNKKSIGEFQIHNHRNCIKFRWNFHNLIKLFNECFEITQVYYNDKNKIL